MHVFKGKGTPGIGDAMFYMNIAHRYAHDNNTPVELQIHWNHDEDYNYHFEDPESIIEKIEYIHNFYYENSRVIINHFFNSTPEDVWKYRMLLDGKVCVHHEEYPGFKDKLPINWLFEPKFKRQTIKNKVVIYRSKFNAEAPRKWKRFTNDKAVDILKELKYNVIEIDYRTPIREVMWHINDADFIVGYDGMWHHVAQLFFKPMLILSNDSISKKFTPGAKCVSNGKEHNYLNFLNDLKRHTYKELKSKARSHEKKLKHNIRYKG